MYHNMARDTRTSARVLQRLVFYTNFPGHSCLAIEYQVCDIHSGLGTTPMTALTRLGRRLTQVIERVLCQQDAASVHIGTNKNDNAGRSEIRNAEKQRVSSLWFKVAARMATRCFELRAASKLWLWRPARLCCVVDIITTHQLGHDRTFALFSRITGCGSDLQVQNLNQTGS